MSHLFLQLDPELNQRARKLAAKNNISLNELILEALLKHVEQSERERHQDKVQLSQSYYGQSANFSQDDAFDFFDE